MELLTDDASDSESEQQAFDTTTLLLDGINAANRCDIHDDNKNRKNMVPFLKSNYKYKRRLPQLAIHGNRPRVVNYSVTHPKQVEVEQSCFKHLTPPLSDSYFKVVAVGFIVSAVVVFRDILLNFLRRIARDSWVWCINRKKIHRRLSEMSGEVKRFASANGRWRHGAVSWSTAIGLEYVSASLKLIYLTLFIALSMTVYEVEAGSCWMNRMDNGNCEKIYSRNITKAECCGTDQMFSYTEKNLSDVEYFFAVALNGGTECVPCLESCKNVVCGPNKRCVKRKGRPKCICSPQCGSGKKHKKSQKRKQQQQQHIHQQNGQVKPPHVIDVSRTKEHVSLVNFHSPITVRDVRSLSSEIHNNPSAVSAMVLTSPGEPISQSNSRRKNQRIPITTNPTKKQVNPSSVADQHRPHHHHHHHHNKQNKKDQGQRQKQHSATVTSRRHANTDRNKGDKLIITADDMVRPSTERDNDLAESNSLRDIPSTTGAGTSADNHHPHQQQQHGRHHFKKHAKPKHKITDQNGVTHNSVHNGTTIKGTTTTSTSTSTMATANRNEMKMPERRRHRTQSFVGSFASSPLDQGYKQQKLIPSSIKVHLRQDNSDHLTFDDKIHNGFFSNGFPYPHQELSTDEGRYSHPVCGSDGRTYNTECQLKKRACRTDNTALVVAYRGHCQTSCKMVNCLNGLQCVEDHYAIPHCIVCSIECPIDDAVQKIDPARAVCGVDGNTYKSTCDINRMVCKIGRSIAVAYPGPCREDRTSCSDVSCGPKMTCLTDLLSHRPRCVSCKFKCPRKRRPASIRYEEGKLCGTNNRTYYSWCEMKKDSCQTGFYIDIRSIGECQQQQQ